MLQKNLINKSSLSKKYSKPDSGTVSALNSIKMNPKFAKLLAFSLNCLMSQTTLPNNKHRDNSRFIYTDNGFQNVIQSMVDHNKTDQIVQYSAGVLNRIIGVSKFREDNISVVMIESDLIGAVYKVQMTNHELSNESVRQILSLTSNLTQSQQLHGRIAKEKLIEGTVAMLRENSCQFDEIKIALDLIHNLLPVPAVQKNMDAVELCKQLMLLMEDNQDNIAIVNECMKLLQEIVNIDEILKRVREAKAIDVKKLVQIMNKTNDNDINTRGAQILMKIISNEDIQRALQSLHQQDADAEYFLGLLASLIMADGFLEQILEQGGTLITDMFEILRNAKKLLKKNKGLVKNCIITFGRIANIHYETTQKLVTQGLVQLLLDCLECDDGEIISDTIDTIMKVSASYESNYKSIIILKGNFNQFLTTGSIEKILKTMNNNVKDPRIIETGIQFLLSCSIDSQALNLILQHKATQLTIKILEQHNQNQVIMDGNATLMYVLANEAEDSIAKKDVINLIIKFLTNHPLWLTANLYYIKVLNLLLARDQEARTIIQKSNPLLIIACILCKREFIRLRRQIQASRSEKEDDEEDDDFDDGSFKVFSKFQQRDLNQQCLDFIEKTVQPTDLPDLVKELVDNQTLLMKTQDDLTSINLEIAIIKLACISLSFELVEQLLRHEHYQALQQLSSNLLKMNEWTEKKDIQGSTLLFWSHFSGLFWDLFVKDIYKQKNITIYCLDYVYATIEKAQHRDTIKQCLDSFYEIGGGLQDKATFQLIINKNTLLDVENKDQQRSYAEKILISFQNVLNKYMTDEELELRTLEAIKVYLSFEVFEQLFLTGGLARLLLNRLDEESTSNQFGTGAINILYSLAYKSKQTLIKLEEMKALTQTLQFIQANKYDVTARNQAQPFIVLLSSINFERFFSNDLQKSLIDLINQANPQDEKFKLDVAVEYNDLLGVYCLVDKILSFQIENHIVQLIVDVLVFCNKDPGYEPNYCDRLISSASLIIQRIIKPNTAPRQLIQIASKQLILSDVSNLLLVALKDRSHSRLTATIIIFVLSEFCRYPEFLNQLVVCLEKEQQYITLIIDLISFYRDDENTLKDINFILYTSAKNSKIVSSYITQRKFIRNLIRTTKFNVLFEIQIKEDQIISRMNWLESLSDIGDTGILVGDEGGIDLCIAIIRYEVSQEKQQSSNVKRKISKKTQENNQLTQHKLMASRLKKAMHKQISSTNEHKTLQSSLRLFLRIMRALQSTESAQEKLQIELKNIRIPLLIQVFSSTKQDREVVSLGLHILLILLTYKDQLDLFFQLDGEVILKGLQQYYTQDSDILDLINKILNLFRNSKSVIQTKISYLNISMQVIDNYSDPQVVSQIENVLFPMTSALKDFKPEENDEDNLSQSTKVIGMIQQQFKKCLVNIDLMIKLLNALYLLAEEFEQNKTTILESKIPYIILSQTLTDQILRTNNKLTLKLIDYSFRLLNTIMPHYNTDVRLLNVDETGQEIITWEVEYIKATHHRYTELWGEHGVELGKSKLRNIEAGMQDNKQFYAPVMSAIVDSSILDEYRLSSAQQYTRFIRDASFFEPLFISRIFGISSIALSLQNSFLHTFENKQEEFIMLASRLFTGWLGLEVGFNKVASNEYYQQLLIFAEALLNDFRQDQQEQNINMLLELQLFLIAQLSNGHHKGELSDTTITRVIANMLHCIRGIYEDIPNGLLAQRLLLTQLRIVYFLSRDLPLSRSVTQIDYDLIIGALSTIQDKIISQKQQSENIEQQQTLKAKRDFDNQIIQYIDIILCYLNKNSVTIGLSDTLNSLSSANKILTNTLNFFKGNPLACLKALQTIENTLTHHQPTLNDDEIKEVEKFLQLGKELITTYPDIVIFEKVCKNLENFKVNGVILEATDINIPLITIDEILAPPIIEEIMEKEIIQQNVQSVINVKDFSRMSMQTFQNVEGLNKIMNTLNEGEEEQLKTDKIDVNKLVEQLLIMAQSQDQALKIVNMGIIDTLLKINSSKSLPVQYKTKIWEVLALICTHPKVVKKLLGTNQDLYESLKQQTLFYPQKGLLADEHSLICKYVLEICGQVSIIQKSLINFSKSGCIEQILLILKNNNESDDLIDTGLTCLSKLLVEEIAIEKFLQAGGLEFVRQLYDQYRENTYFSLLIIDNRDIRKKLDLIIEMVAIQYDTKTKINEIGIQDCIIEGLKSSISKDTQLVSSGCKALAYISLKHFKNTQKNIESNLIEIIQNIQEEDLNSQIVLSISHLYNSLSYEDDEFRIKLGQMHVIEHLIRIFHNNSKPNNLNTDILIQCLQALSNLAQIPANSEMIAKYMFSDYLGNFIIENHEQKNVIQLGLSVIQTTCSLIYALTTKDKAKENLFVQISTEKTIEALRLCLTFSEQDKAIIVSALITLTFLVSSLEIAGLFFSLQGEVRTLKLIKNMTSDKEIAYFSLRLLTQALKYDKNKTGLYMELLVPLDMKEVLRTHNENAEIFNETLQLGILLLQNDSKVAFRFQQTELTQQILMFADQNELNESQDNNLFKILLLIVKSSDQNLKAICQEASICILSILNQRQMSEELTDTGSLVLDLFTQHPEGINQIYANKGINTCVMLLEIHQAHDNIEGNVQFINANNLKVALTQEEYRLTVANAHLEQLKTLHSQEKLTLFIKGKLKELIENIQKPLSPTSQITAEIRTFLMKGTICTMYFNFKLLIIKRFKDDGSRSNLRFFFNKYLTEINCRLDRQQFIKPKWRLNISKIAEIRENYKDNPKQFQQSAFENVSLLTKAMMIFQQRKIDPAKCFSLIATSGTKPKSLNAHCNSIQDKKVLINYINLVLSEKEQLIKVQNDETSLKQKK